MVSAVTSNLIVAVSFVALLVFLSAVRKVVRAGEWSRTATLAVLIAACAKATVDVAVTYLGVWSEGKSGDGNTIWEHPALWHQVWRGLCFALGLVAVVAILVRARRRDVMVDIPAVLLVVVALISFASSILHGDNPFRPVSVVYVVLLVACTVAPRGLGIHLGVGAFATFIALASGFALVGFIAPKGHVVMPCTTDKCGVLDFMYGGVMGNENAFALYFALAMPFVYIAFRGWQGAMLCAYILGLTLLTGSRSGEAAGVVTFIALIALRPDVRRPTAAPIRSSLIYVGMIVGFIVGMVVPFSRHDLAAFTGRALLWSVARQELSDPADKWYGIGVYGMDRLLNAGLISLEAYSVHNQWLQVLFSSGIIGLVLFLAAMVLMLWQARGGYTVVVGCVLVPFFMLSVTERPWVIDSIDWVVWVVPAALLCYPAIRRKRKPPSAAPNNDDEQRLEDAMELSSEAMPR